MRQLFLAGDSGGSKTALRLLDCAGNVISEARVAGMANSFAGVLPVRETLSEGLKRLDQPLDSIGFVFCSVGGPNAPEVEEAFHALLPNAERIWVVREGKGIMQLEVGRKVGASAAVLAGTGSVAYSRIDGVFHFSGGWGPQWDDRGSGFDLGKRALQLRLREIDGRSTPSDLARIFTKLEEGLDLTNYDGLMALQKRVLALTRAEVAAFAPAIFELAKSSQTAYALVAQIVDELTALACAVTPVAPEKGFNGILATGGIFHAGEDFRQLCRERLVERRPQWKWLFLNDSGMLGPASYMALKMAGITNEAIIGGVAE